MILRSFGQRATLCAVAVRWFFYGGARPVNREPLRSERLCYDVERSPLVLLARKSLADLFRDLYFPKPERSRDGWLLISVSINTVHDANNHYEFDLGRVYRRSSASETDLSPRDWLI